MNVTLNENILTVVTPIERSVAAKAFSAMTVTDEKTGDILCTVSVQDGEGNISALGLTCNTVVDGKLAVKKIMPMGTTMDDVKKQYGQALVKVNKYIDKISENISAEIAAIDGIFTEDAPRPAAQAHA